jgi:hypothetical protein
VSLRRQCRPDFGQPVAAIRPLLVKQPTMLLTVVTQTPPFRGLTTDSGSVGEALLEAPGAI